MFLSKKKNTHETTCFVCHVIVSLLLLAVSAAALANVLASHYSIERAMFVFGTNAGPLSLIAFSISISLWMKSIIACMSGCAACGTNGKK